MKDELSAICANVQYNGTCNNEVWEIVNAVYGFEKADAIVKLLNEDNKNLEPEDEYVTTLITYEGTDKEPICSFCKEPISIFSGCSNKNCVQHIKKEKYFTYGLGNKQIFPYTNINSVLIKNNNISNWAQILNSKGEKLHTYTYIATLLNGTKIKGEYESNNSNSQKIEIPEATEDNPTVSLLIQKKEITNGS